MIIISKRIKIRKNQIWYRTQVLTKIATFDSKNEANHYAGLKEEYDFHLTKVNKNIKYNKDIYEVFSAFVGKDSKLLSKRHKIKKRK